MSHEPVNIYMALKTPQRRNLLTNVYSMQQRKAVRQQTPAQQQQVQELPDKQTCPRHSQLHLLRSLRVGLPSLHELCDNHSCPRSHVLDQVL